MGDKLPSWVILVLRILFGIILGVIMGGAGIFGYIAWKAKAKKWSGLMFAVVGGTAFLFYWLILNDILNILPF